MCQETPTGLTQDGSMNLIVITLKLELTNLGTSRKTLCTLIKNHDLTVKMKIAQ